MRVKAEQLEGLAVPGRLIRSEGEWHRVVAIEHACGTVVLEQVTTAKSRELLFVAEDLGECVGAPGQLLMRYEQSWVIDALDYKTSHGTFIRLRALEEEAWEDSWVRHRGIEAQAEHPYEIRHLITFKEQKGGIRSLGYVVCNHVTQQGLMLTYEETWRLVFNQGARNAVASMSTLGPFTTYLIDSIDGFPAFDSFYWRLSVPEAKKRKFHGSAAFMKALKRYDI